MKVRTALRYLEDRWDDRTARGLDEVELLRYRSNLLRCTTGHLIPVDGGLTEAFMR